MLARRQADDRQPGLGVAERRHRRVPPVGMLGAAFLAERHQPRAQRAVARRFGLRQRGKVGGLSICTRHCEDASDEAIQSRKLDCFASLAMTVRSDVPSLRHRHRIEPAARPLRAAAQVVEAAIAGSTTTSACSTPRRSCSTRPTAPPGAISPMPWRWSKATCPARDAAPSSRRIERDFGRRRASAGGRGARPRHRRLGAAAVPVPRAEYPPSALASALRPSAAGRHRARLADPWAAHRPPSCLSPCPAGVISLPYGKCGDNNGIRAAGRTLPEASIPPSPSPAATWPP